MAKSGRRTKRKSQKQRTLHADTKNSVIAVAAIGFAVILVLSGFDSAGPAGHAMFRILEKFLGWGYYLIPAVLTIIGLNILTNAKRAVTTPALIGAGFFIASGLGIIDVIHPGGAGIIGNLLGNLELLFGYAASLVVNFTILVAAVIVALNIPLRINAIFPKIKRGEKKAPEPKIIMPEAPVVEPEPESSPEETADGKKSGKEKSPEDDLLPSLAPDKGLVYRSKNYVFPPLSLLKSLVEKPTVGDLRANANIIKRTLESFGIPVEMGEITIGPKVTRYALKPAEGVKLSRILALNQDLSLALAAHPIRIEAPIPGKSLVGIEVPNKTGSIVRLGSLLNYPDFKKTNNLSFPLGRDVAGEPLFVSLGSMPHLLIAGATGSGKSVTIHSFIISLLFKNSPETLRFIMIDPKRVELSVYEGIPHLVTPVITDGKRAVGTLRFAIHEMEKRYEILLGAGKRDILSYNKGRNENFMPYIIIIIDELADLMTAFGREVETSVVRLAQMARATGIHLVVSTQRPSVEVITGLIKANITSRVALQVASQVDSRTILDSAGAEKLLGGGDMLFISSDFSKPRRIQGSYITDDEVNDVARFIKKNNPELPDTNLDEDITENLKEGRFQDFVDGDADDELYDEAIDVVREAKKASASLLQRRLRIGYARAARLIDMMEEHGIVGPGEGAKPRAVFISDDDEREYDKE